MEIRKKNKEKYANLGFRAKKKAITGKSMRFIFHLAYFISPDIPVSKHEVVKAYGLQKAKSQPFFHFGTRWVWALSITLRPF